MQGPTWPNTGTRLFIGTSDRGIQVAWRGGVTLAIIAALAFWGFRNVLGKQSPFRAAAFDG